MTAQSRHRALKQRGINARAYNGGAHGIVIGRSSSGIVVALTVIVAAAAASYYRVVW